MYKKGTGNDKQGKDAGNRTLCPKRNFSQAIKSGITFCLHDLHDIRVISKGDEKSRAEMRTGQIVLHMDQ